MNTDRLKHLITVLEAVPPKQLSLNVWRIKGTDCGTVACAVGWACLDPVFIAQGLGTDTAEMNYSPKFGKYEHFEAITKFFGINGFKAHRLFSATAYDSPQVTPADVIARIKKLIGE